MKKYELLAEHIEFLITSGTLQAGERLPSVRETTAARGVSPSTVFEAYDLLETRGLVEARPRSGYFVKQRPGARAPARDEVPPPKKEAGGAADAAPEPAGRD